MDRQQLINWLKQAEPLDRPSTLADPQLTAITASKKLALMGLGSADLYRQAVAVETAQDCAAVLCECLRLLGVEDEPDNLLTVNQAACRLQVSETVIRDACQDGRLRHSRFGRGRGTIRITSDDLAAFAQDMQGRTRPLLRHLT